MSSSERQSPISLSFSALLFAAAAFASGRGALFLTAAAAAILHELGHILAARLVGVRLGKLSLDLLGARLVTRNTLFSYKKELFICAAGPAVNFLCAAFALPHPGATTFAAASIALGTLNLLPVESFDGGRILSASLSLFLPPDLPPRILRALSFATVFTLWTVSVFLLLRTSESLSVFVFSLSLFIRLF